MTTETTLAILVDALRPDYVTEEDAPYLASLSDDGVSTRLRETFGFQTRPAYFAGLYPGQSDICQLYTYEPYTSPFAAARVVPRPFRRLIDRSPASGAIRRVLHKIGRTVESRRGHDSSSAIATTRRIPLDLVDLFGVSEKFHIQSPDAFDQTTLFDVLRREDRDWLWIGYPNDNQYTDAIEKAFEERIKPSHEFVHLHYAELDWIGHEHGPDSDQRRETLNEIDRSIERVVSHAESVFDQVNVIVFGDHGMVPVTESVDVISALDRLDWSCPDDFVYFADSNQVRFWYSSDACRDDIIEAISALGKGDFFTEEDREELDADISERYGEEIFLTDPGVIVSPNFFQGDGDVAGMHGYHPDTRANDAAIIIADRRDKYTDETGELNDLVDVFPTLLEVMDLPVPETNQGHALVERS